MRLEHRRIEQREPHSLVALPAVRKYPSGRRVHIVIFSMPLVLNQVRRGFRYGVPWTKHRSGLDGERDARNSGGVVTVFAYLFRLNVIVSPISITIRSSPISSLPE